MNRIEAKRDGDHVVITVRVGTKTARMTVTAAYAVAFADELVRAAGGQPGDRLLDYLEGLLHGGRDA